MQLEGLVLHVRGAALQDAHLTPTILNDVRAADQIQPRATQQSGNDGLEDQADADQVGQQVGQASLPQRGT